MHGKAIAGEDDPGGEGWPDVPARSKLTPDPDDIEKYFLGSLLSGGGSGPQNKANYTLQGWTDMVDGYQKHAAENASGNPADLRRRCRAWTQQYPRRRRLSAQHRPGLRPRPKLVENIERVTAVEVRATGINWVFAPA